MTSTTAMRGSHRTATGFEQYVSGRRAPGEGTVFFLESVAHVGGVLDIAVPGDLLFAPEVNGGEEREVTVVGYDGSFLEPGDEMVLDGRHTFELQDYLAAPFISIVGLTVVRQGSAEGVVAFLSDADTARHSGVFVDQLLSSAVLLDSRASLDRPDTAPAELTRVHVTADGEYRDGPDGLLLGRLGDDRADIEATAATGAGRGRAFARVIDRRFLEGEFEARPWFGRYLAALDLLRQWDGAPTRPAISGFGGHLVTALDDRDPHPASVSTDAPFLVTGDGEEYILVDRRSRRRFRLGVDAARAAECLIAMGDEQGASALLASELERPVGSIGAVVREVRARFADAGVDLTSYAPGASS